MFGLRATAQRLRDRISDARDNDADSFASSNENAAMIAHAIYHRENAGQTTSLRQLHHIVEITQPQAIRTITDLEANGMVDIEQDIADALGSKVTLTRRMRERLETILQRKSA